LFIDVDTEFRLLSSCIKGAGLVVFHGTIRYGSFGA